MSYLISLNPKLFKNIAHVGSLENFVFVFVFVFVLKLTVGVMGKDISAYNHFHRVLKPVFVNPFFLELFCLCLSVCVCICHCHCHCHRWGSVDNMCHQLSEFIWLDSGSAMIY